MDSSTSVLDDPVYRRGIVDLLGLLAYGELSASERLAEDAKLAPDLHEKVEIARMGVTEFGHFEQLRGRLVELGADPFEVMGAFAPSFEQFHHKTAPKDWLEGLVKVYVGDGIASDFYREVAAFLDAGTRQLVIDTLEDIGNNGFVVETVRRAIEADPRVAGRLALWGRRIMGEALVQAQMVVAEHESLTAVVVGGADRPGSIDLAAIGRMFARISESHAERMATLGLAS